MNTRIADRRKRLVCNRLGNDGDIITDVYADHAM
jgi:hypothetical protein